MRYLVISTTKDQSVFNVFLELDNNNMEQRKIEIINKEILGFACKEFSYRRTFLADTSLLSNEELLNEVNAKLFEIDQEGFEAYWNQVITVAGSVNKE